MAAAPVRRAGKPADVAAGGPRQFALTGARGGTAIDWDAVRERTRRFEKTRAEHDLLAGERAFTPRLGELVEEARASVGPAPGFFRRFHFPSATLEVDRQRLTRGAAAVHEAEKLLGRDVEHAKAYLGLLEGQRWGHAGGAQLASSVSRQQEMLRVRSAEAGRLLERVGTGIGLKTGAFWARARLYGRQLIGRDPATAMADLEARLLAWGATRPAPVLSAELTYVQGTLKGGPLPQTSISPAYASAAGSYVLEDTTEGREVELSSEVQAKATALGTAKAAHDFVRNEVKLDWYFGCQKGSTETLRSMRGNDADLSALLVALLRAQSTPARYVQGTIELPVARLAELMGLLDSADVDALDAGALDAARVDAVRDLAMNALGAAGVPYEPVISGGRVSDVRFLHTWVEAFIPYANYRGVGIGKEGRQWVPLEPTIHGRARYGADAGALDGYAVAGLTAERIATDYLSAPRADSPLEFVQGRVRAYLAANRSDVPYEKAVRRVVSRTESLPFIPGTLPFMVTSVHGEYAFLPDEAKHRARITVADGSGNVVDVTIPMHQLVGHRAVLAYKPATEADADAIALAGGLYAAPAAAVQVLPVIRVDGRERAAGTRALGLGVEHGWTIEMLLPDGSSRRIDNRIIAGNLVAMGFGSPGNGYIETPPADGSDLDGPAPRFLYGRAAAYARSWTQAEEDFAALLRIVPVRPTANVVLVDNQLDVDQVLGVRRRLIWKGLEVDADHRSMTPLELVAGRGKELLRLSGYEGSYLESRVLLDGTGEESVSAVVAIQQARAQGVPVVTLTKSSTGDELAGLSATAEVLRDVQDQLARGREVMIPIASVSVRDWVGTGFIARDPATEEGGYFLSGHVSGGQTVVSPSQWTDQDLVGDLQNPDAPPSTKDQTAIARVEKSTFSDMQEVVVGNRFPSEFVVFVKTFDRIPVAGAQVRFWSAQPALLTFTVAGSDVSQSSVIVTTDTRGRAAVRASPDTLVGHYGVLKQGTQRYPQLVGLNEIGVEAIRPDDTRVQVLEPFRGLGLPDVPARVALITPTAWWAPDRMVLGQDLPATVLDKWGNALANQEVNWTQTPDSGAFLDPGNLQRDRVVMLNPSDPAQQRDANQVTPTSGTVAIDYINGGGSHEVRARVGTSTVSAAYTVGAADTRGIRYVFGYVPTTRSSFDGIYTGSSPEPYVFQLLRPGPAGGPAWVPIREADYSAVAVTMSAKSGGSFLDLPVTRKPSDVTIASTDTVDNVVFWPRYLAQDASQELTFTAEVRLQDGTVDCCESSFTFQQRSSTVPVSVWRVLPEDLLLPVAAGGSLLGDQALAFDVTNRASYSIYASVTQQPTIASEQLVQVPPPEAVPRRPGRPDLMEIPPFATSRLYLGRVDPNHGGDVNLEVYAPDFASGPDELVQVASKSTRVSTLRMQITNPAELGAFVVRGDATLDRIVADVEDTTTDVKTWQVSEDAVVLGERLSEFADDSDGPNPLSDFVGAPVPRRGQGEQFLFVPNAPKEHDYAPGVGGGPNSCRGCAAEWWYTLGRITDANCGNGCRDQKSPALTYTIQVQRGLEVATQTLVQDEISVIQQEYLNHGLDDMMPPRTAFKPVSASPKGYYSVAELTTTAYSLVPATPGKIADAVMETFNVLMGMDQPLREGQVHKGDPIIGPGPVVVVNEKTGATLAVVTTPTCYPNSPDSCSDYYVVDAVHGLPIGIEAGDDSPAPRTHVRRAPFPGAVAAGGLLKPPIQSAWRNPERNEAVGGAQGSEHQNGSAIDFTLPADVVAPDQGIDQTKVVWCVLLAAARQVPDVRFTQAEKQGGIQRQDCTLTTPTGLSGINHVHVE
jgi:hypothetical protein